MKVRPRASHPISLPLCVSLSVFVTLCSGTFTDMKVVLATPLRYLSVSLRLSLSLSVCVSLSVSLCLSVSLPRSLARSLTPSLPRARARALSLSALSQSQSLGPLAERAGLCLRWQKETAPRISMRSRANYRCVCLCVRARAGARARTMPRKHSLILTGGQAPGL